MRSLEWSTSHAVFVSEIDDEHKEIFESIANLQTLLSSDPPCPELEKPATELAAAIQGHFAHEERLMRAARYDLISWHKARHDGARKRITQFVKRIKQGDPDGGLALIEYLTSWLHDHTRLSDMMLGAFLRNHMRGLYKMKFRAGTRPAGACAWFNSKGERFDPDTAGNGD